MAFLFCAAQNAKLLMSPCRPQPALFFENYVTDRLVSIFLPNWLLLSALKYFSKDGGLGPATKPPPSVDTSSAAPGYNTCGRCLARAFSESSKTRLCPPSFLTCPLLIPSKVGFPQPQHVLATLVLFLAIYLLLLARALPCEHF